MDAGELMLSIKAKHIRTGVRLLIATAGAFSTAGAQEKAEPCEEYAACALRIETGGFFSGSSIVRGVTGEKVAGIGGHPVLDSLFRASDSAAAWYGRFEKSHRTATWLSRTGALLFLASGFVPLVTDRSDTTEAVWLGLSIGGLGFAVASSFPGRSAQRSMSRAIWWYNADLVR
jgi:hypothetical protein